MNNKDKLIDSIDYKIDHLIDDFNYYDDNLLNIKNYVHHNNLTTEKLEYLNKLIDMTISYELSIDEFNSTFNKYINTIHFKRNFAFYAQFILAIVFIISMIIGIAFI